MPKVRKKQRNQKCDLCKTYVQNEDSNFEKFLNPPLALPPPQRKKIKSKVVCDQVLLQRSLCLFEIGPEQ